MSNILFTLFQAETPAHRIWDATPAPGQSSFDETPMASRTPGAETPHHSATPSNKRNRWDEVSLNFSTYICL